MKEVKPCAMVRGTDGVIVANIYSQLFNFADEALFNNSFRSTYICWSFNLQQFGCDNTCGLHICCYNLAQKPQHKYGDKHQNFNEKRFHLKLPNK